VIRSDVSEAHRLSLSARVLSALDGQVKAKRQPKKRLCRLRNRRFGHPPVRPSKAKLELPNPAKSLFYPGNIGRVNALRLIHSPLQLYQSSSRGLGRASGVPSMEMFQGRSLARGFALNPRRRHRRRQSDRPLDAGCGSDRPRVAGTCHWPRATVHAIRVRSPCHLKSR
jgi:hypothetical protein